jgi:hypothetical protein
MRWASAARRVRTLPAAAAVLALAGCADSPARPSVPGITLGVPSTVTGKYVSCAACETPLVVVAEFSVVVGDPAGPGGTVERVEIVATDASRGAEVARNVRPNADVPYPVTALPSGGSLTLAAGVVISPAPPPKDAVTVSVTVRLTDGRASTGSAPLVVSEARSRPSSGSVHREGNVSWSVQPRW